jgi:hypothetical protein
MSDDYCLAFQCRREAPYIRAGRDEYRDLRGEHDVDSERNVQTKPIAGRAGRNNLLRKHVVLTPVEY